MNYELCDQNVRNVRNMFNDKIHNLIFSTILIHNVTNIPINNCEILSMLHRTRRNVTKP